ncbi:MAG: arginine--tRNA ligase [Candidatus Peregrinibacteria bacterium]|nr:arginine--tRNA ligase [Candidatus Peregrinibacteria bacterium]
MYESLTTQARKILAKDFALPDAHITWQRPVDPKHGDVSTAVALQVSKELKLRPKEIASTLATHLASVEGVAKAEVAGAGYVNVWLTPAALLMELQQSRTAHTASVTRKSDRPVIVEYSQPNIAKPLGIHHILSTVIGQAITNLYRHHGYNTIAINHLGDWGTQFGKLAVAMRKWGEGKTATELGLDGLLALYVRFHEEAEKETMLEDEARAAFKKLEDGDAAMKVFWEEVVQVTMAALERTYERLHVSFDFVHGESFYMDKMQPILEEGKRKGVFHVGEEGALIVEFPEGTNLPPYMVLKGDGATLYSTRDLATVRYRVDQFHPEKILYVVDVAQQLYFQQLFAAVQQLQWDVPILEHVSFGRMSFADRKMSTRKGNILRLEEVLDEAVRRADAIIAARGESIQTEDRPSLATMMGLGAVVYGILSQNRKMDIVFDWDRILSFEGNSAPYLQYTHARAKSVLRKAEAGEDYDLPAPSVPLTERERVLIGTLLLFPQVLREALDTHMPHKVANFLYSLCQDFNAFYNAEPILQAEGDTRAVRLGLTACTAVVLKTGAELLTLRVPDRM